MKAPENNNYCATVIEIKNLIPLSNCDNVVHTSIFGNLVVVDKSTKVGDLGLFFPVETALSKEYISVNNLYRNKDLNVDTTKGGYFEENGRIRCVKFRKNSSQGLFMPIESLNNLGEGIDLDIDLKIGDEFDEILNIPICKKYVPKNVRIPGSGGNGKKGRTLVESRVVENQFRFHADTSQLYKNLHAIKPDDLISITYKMHGTSGVSSKVLCKKAYGKRDRIGEWLHNVYTRITTGNKVVFNLTGEEYFNLYSSRKVIKNEVLRPNANHFYGTDIWGKANDLVKDFLEDGMTLYYEIVGMTPNGGEIQKNFDYGYPKEDKPFGVYIYRITYTNPKGKVFEFSAKQVQDWCKGNGLNAVPQLFYGYAKELSDERMTDENWRNKLLETIKELYNDKDCYMCKNVVPEEGCVVRIEGQELEAFKCKSERFYIMETKQLDKGTIDIESVN